MLNMLSLPRLHDVLRLSAVALVAFLVYELAAASSYGEYLTLSPSRRVLRAAYQAAADRERTNWSADVATDAFYQSPRNISSYAPGQPIRLEQVPGGQYHVPHRLSLFRLMYQSLDMDDRPVPASAFVLLPYARSPRPRSRPRSPRRPLRLLVWAHGTSGIARQCAPSAQRDLYYDFDGAVAMALRGYAVVAPDYAGLGTDTPFHYLAGPAHAADIALAVAAMRQALPSGLVSREWLAVGHSEGGLAVWATNEREAAQPTGGFLGAVAIAPALANLHIIRYGLEHGGLNESLLYSAYTLDTIARLDPSVDVSKFYSETGRQRAALAATACFDTALAVFGDVTFADVFQDPTWPYSSWATAWEDRTAVRGDKPLAKPLLLIEALADRGVYPAIPDAIFANHCARHAPAQLHLSIYPDVGHDAVAYVSQLEYFEWIEDRFNGVPVASDCANATADVVFTDHELGLPLVVEE